MKISKIQSSQKKSKVIKSSTGVAKRPIKASEELIVVDACECKYCDAINLISAAIESLAEIAKDDQIAKDSIANLGVVMLDLKGGC